MKKILVIALAIAVAGVAWAPATYAGIGGSRHDMTDGSNPYVTLAAFADYGACSACHIPHGAQGARLFPNVPVGAAGGFFGPLCMTCHDNGIAGTNINVWASNTALLGHQLSIATLQAADDDETVAGSGLPYTTGDAPSGATNIECLSCHDVHNTADDFRPFLQVTLDDLCEDCHSNRVNNVLADVGFANTNGIHPAGPVFTGDVTGIAAAPNSPFVAGWGAELVQNPDVGTDGSSWTDTIWDSGMQLSGQGAAGAGGVDCISCHNVHWDEVALDNGTAYLGIVGDNAGNANNTFCEYCHQGDATGSGGGFFWNPGGTLISHPNDDVAANNAAVTADMTWQPGTTSSTAGSGASGLVCTSCHGVHPNTVTGVAETEGNSPILLNYDDVTYNDICQQCHNAGAGFLHHPTGGTYATNGSSIGGVTCAGGDLAPGVDQCHGAGGTGGLAHNRTSPMGNPGTALSGTCVACHTTNPSVYTPDRSAFTANGDASHFVGDADTVAYNNGPTTRAATGAPINYAGTGDASDAGATTWDGSTLTSMWGANDSTIICESCHRLAQGNISSGNKPTGLLVEVAGHAITTVASTVGGSAGYTNAPYMCTGCHWVPGGTHPLEDGDGTAYPAAGWTTDAGQAYNATTTVNCESCHSPHDAETTSGNYVLDGSSAGTFGAGTAMEWEPTINYTDFCAVCHDTFQ